MVAIPDSVVTAGLVGCGLALIVATAQQKWQLKAFFLLALRLAIGWQFLFEGMYKINTYLVGPTETNRVFTSEPYFKVSPTALGETMRKKFDDTPNALALRLSRGTVAQAEFAKLTMAEQAAACPDAVKGMLDKVNEAAEQTLKDQEVEIAKEYDWNMEMAKTDGSKTLYASMRDDKLKSIEEKRKKLSSINPADIEAAKVKYARWVNGLDGRDVKVKFTTGDASLTAPQRLQHIDVLKTELAAAVQELGSGVGNGNGVQVKHVSELRTDVNAAESDLAKDANSFVLELKKEIVGWDVPDRKVESEGKRMDRVTMWFIAVVGACILFGFLTRISCVLAAGFLLVTYVTHPPFPWYTLPPMTEGNPLFVNKNLIEMFALLVLACYPTGRWLGLDAILALFIPCCRKRNCDLTLGS